jgi:hypothetical protein
MSLWFFRNYNNDFLTKTQTLIGHSGSIYFHPFLEFFTVKNRKGNTWSWMGYCKELFGTNFTTIHGWIHNTFDALEIPNERFRACISYVKFWFVLVIIPILLYWVQCLLNMAPLLSILVFVWIISIFFLHFLLHSKGKKYILVPHYSLLLYLSISCWSTFT